jgi:benzoyl-CoA reductase/2-hydroxyglutaryl-CoA dehydratase subunit BcrC/BadD/HgdB
MKFDTAYLDKIEQKIFIEGKNLQEQGVKIIGVYCAFTPKEIISAAGAVPVGLCAGSQAPISTAEQHLPRSLCPLIKSSYGHALESNCPYFNSCDFLVADSTCDGKKKMFELLSRIKPLHLLQLPQTSQNTESIAYWRNEMCKLIPVIENLTGNKITENALSEQIELYNRYRRAELNVFNLNRGNIPLLYGSEVDAITGGMGFDCNLKERIKELDDAVKITLQRAEDGNFLENMKKRPRIIVTGCPHTNKKVLNILEESGAVVVGMENCGGQKTLTRLVDENKDPLTALAERYLSIPCSCMTPNYARLELIGQLVKDYRADGVLELTWQGCHTYNVEAFIMKEYVTGTCGKPYIQIETDYSMNDSSQIKTRIEAFLELI